MRKIRIIIIITIAAAAYLASLSSFTLKRGNMEAELIKETIVKNYVHGAFNETNIEAFRQIFHPEFAIINLQEDGTLFLFTRSMWEEVLRTRLADPHFDYSAIALAPKFRNIEIVGDKASATMDLLLGDKIVYTDFLLLVKNRGEWQVVSKIYHEYKSE